MLIGFSADVYAPAICLRVDAKAREGSLRDHLTIRPDGANGSSALAPYP